MTSESKPTLFKLKTTVKFAVLLVVAILSWESLEYMLDFRIPDTIALSTPNHGPISVVYANCTKIPPAPKGMVWPEEHYLHDPKIADIREVADAERSRVWIEGKSKVKVGDTVIVKVVLYDGFGKRKTLGGDLVRVWMREPGLGAATSALMTDNGDGTYTATFTAFWQGRPAIKAAIVAPRELIAIQFRRRYICPPVVMNTAIFEHPTDHSRLERTPCNFDPEIPGYPDLCNFTSSNYGSPWYCGKPRTQSLLCHDWLRVSNRNLLENAQDIQILSDLEKKLYSLTYLSMIIPTNIALIVEQDGKNATRLVGPGKCFNNNVTLTWPQNMPTSYMYNRKWISRHCSGRFGNDVLQSCMRSTDVIMIGDSTVRQFFDAFRQRVVCSWHTGAGKAGLKHRPGVCVNRNLNFTLLLEEHSFPFITSDTPRGYMKTFEAHLGLITGERRTVVILHAFTHFLSHHSHVFYEALRNMKRGILDLLRRKPDTYVIIKGPNTYSFAKNVGHLMWTPDIYADVYQRFISNVFSDLKDRVLFLECQDITIATEQWHVHAEQYVIDALTDNLFSHICPY